jgi:very-short-patch-repair endonuclease
VQYQLKALQQLWSDIAEAPIGAVMRRLPIWLERCSIIETAQQMALLINRARDVFQRMPMMKPPVWHDGEQLRMLQRQLKSVVVQKDYAVKRQAIDTIADQAAKRAHSSVAHPIVRTIADALKRRDVEAYRAAHAQLKELWAERERVARSDELLKKLAERLPKAAKAISDDPCDTSWDQRLSRLGESWVWLKTDRWLKQQLDPKHFEYLQSERKSLQEQLQAHLTKLAAAKAWFHCMTRMTPAEETYLKAWMQAIRNIGAGTGKRADRFRKVARQTLDRCRSAIPAWIMPIHRVAETVNPGEDQFDVVIVDEASQSGAEALFLHYIAKKIIIVGDDKQIAPYNVGINRDDVELLRGRYIPDLPLTDYFDLDHSFFDQAYLRFGNRIRLCEHFRCMPEIIQFSNKLCYSNEPLLPLRQFGDGRIEPVVVARRVPEGHMEGASPNVVNRGEAEAIVKQIAKLIADPTYKDKTMGVISLLGEKQARLIEEKLLVSIGPEEMERRRLICGDAYSFQGDERHVMFISLVAAADEGRRLATLTQAADERRFNVAASRARDQMWLFHSLMPDDLSAKCLRRQLLEYCLKPEVPQETGEEVSAPQLETLSASADRTRVPPPPPFESWLEVDVFLQLRNRGYRVLPQHSFAGYRIDLVVNGTNGRLAVECNAEEWPGQDRYDSDMDRQRQLERCGWRFWRIRGGAFYRNPDAALQPLWDLLEKHGIRSRSAASPEASPTRPMKVEPPKRPTAAPEEPKPMAKKPARRGNAGAQKP